ncbi:intradiol ring-cleavage dioxygenase [Pedobacter sp. Hv1]|uniref:dioxygenase family protein n=1 Tax=Pedobacter sp. Hv1 TaxID=1740090 RepID=UPI0006D8BC07|nr:intradiol ring-cleavage dioxygenase [Pedobacter sp. Hv1]KQC00316.1 intradiol ring-cleavage dioxygenase [Pedobacter sp. Hv1]
MSIFKPIYYLMVISILAIFSSCNGQTLQPATQTNTKLVGGFCDGCELLYVGLPQQVNSVDTSAGWKEKGQKLLVTGIAYQLDGQTPAPNTIIYYWQTDNDGYYSPRPNLDKKALKHGHIRGWVKTDKDGKYAIYTIRPATYPDRSEPAHIHIAIKEPQLNEYYIDELVFDDDPLLIPKRKKTPFENRGGSGILRILLSGDLQIAEHNIILGLNIPNYPKTNTSAKKSGLEVGEDNPSFTPFHTWGPDKGTRTCPVCKYGRYHGLVYFVGNQPNWEEIKKWLTFFEQESAARSKYLKAYFVYGNENGYQKEQRQKELAQIGKELGLKYMALTFVPSMQDKESEVNLNKINPRVENTIILYRHRSIIAKFIDLKPEEKNFKHLTDLLNKTKSSFFDLPEPVYH